MTEYKALNPVTNQYETIEPPKRGPGRPRGSKDRTWSKIETWYALITQNMKFLKPEQKVRLGQWGCELLVGKMREIASPDESKANVEETMKLLKEMENRPAK